LLVQQKLLMDKCNVVKILLWEILTTLFF